MKANRNERFMTIFGMVGAVALLVFVAFVALV